MGHFDDLVRDMRAWRARRADAEAERFEKSLAVDDGEPVMIKAMPSATRSASRFAADPDPRRFAHVADSLIRTGEARPGTVLETFGKAMPPPRPGPPQFSEANARARLMKAINAGECTAREAALAEGKINRLAVGQRLAKAGLPALPLAEKTGHEAARLATKPDHAPTQVDTAGHIYRANRLLSSLLADKKISATDAAKLEARLIRASDDEAAMRPTPGKAERIAATQRAGMLLRDIARAGGLDALGVAAYESQIHSLEVTLGMGVPGDVGDPMEAAA